jgi:hypothetical protein
MPSDKLKFVVEDLEAFKVTLNDAVSNAQSEYDVTLANDMADRFEKWGGDMFITSKQLEQVKRISGEEDAL